MGSPLNRKVAHFSKIANRKENDMIGSNEKDIYPRN
jgi:hypothetical protein